VLSLAQVLGDNTTLSALALTYPPGTEECRSRVAALLQGNSDWHVGRCAELARVVQQWAVEMPSAASTCRRAAARIAVYDANRAYSPCIPVDALRGILSRVLRDAPVLWRNVVALARRVVARHWLHPLANQSSGLVPLWRVCAQCALGEAMGDAGTGEAASPLRRTLSEAVGDGWLALHAHELCDVLGAAGSGEDAQTGARAHASDGFDDCDSELDTNEVSDDVGCVVVLGCADGGEVRVPVSTAQAVSATLCHMLESAAGVSPAGAGDVRVALPQLAAADVETAIFGHAPDSELSLGALLRAVVAANFLAAHGRLAALALELALRVVD
jgi:hypothetical protein